MAKTLTPAGKFAFILLIVAGLACGLIYMRNAGLMSKIAPKGKETKGAFVGKKSDVLKVCVNTWGGFAPGILYNEGFKASSNSRYTKEYGVNVEFVLIDDFQASREAWKSGAVDLLWITADVFPTEAKDLSEFKPKILFQVDWSRGGDAIVVRPGINSVSDLKGKKIAFALGTPSQTLLVWLLEAGNLKYEELNIVQAKDAIDAAAMFKAGKVDAAVCWSPDDQDCLKAIHGAKILKSTKDASNAIADVFYAKEEYIQGHEKELKAFMKGWFRAVADIRSTPSAKQKAIQLMSDGFSQPVDFMSIAIDNAYLSTYGDNVNFFNLNGGYNGITGEELYNRMADAFHAVNLAPAQVPNWRLVTNTAILRSMEALSSEEGQEAERAATFSKPTKAVVTAEAVATKPVTINFPTGVYALDDNCKYIIDQEFGPIVKSFAHSRIRVEGNTDDVGDRASNMILSKKRAQSVADYLVKTYGCDRNRFVVVGNGPDKPVASNDTPDGKSKNRRTDFQLLNE